MEAIRREASTLQVQFHPTFPYAVAITTIAVAILIRCHSNSSNPKSKARLPDSLFWVYLAFFMYVHSIEPVKVRSANYRYSMGGDRMLGGCALALIATLLSGLGLKELELRKFTSRKIVPCKGNLPANAFFAALTTSYFVMSFRLFKPVFIKPLGMGPPPPNNGGLPPNNGGQHQHLIEKPIRVHSQENVGFFYGGTGVENTDSEQFDKFKDDMAKALSELNFQEINLDFLNQNGGERNLLDETRLKNALAPLHQVILEFDQRPRHPNEIARQWNGPKPPIPSFGIAYLFPYRGAVKCLVLSWETCQIAVLPKDKEHTLENIQLSRYNELLSGTSEILNGTPIDLPKPSFFDVPLGCYVKMRTGHEDKNQAKQDLLNEVDGENLVHAVDLSLPINIKRAGVRRQLFPD